MNKSKIVFIAGLALMFVSYFLPYAHMEKEKTGYVVQPEATHIFLSMAAVKDSDKCESESDAARAILAVNVLPGGKLGAGDVILSLLIPILAGGLIAFAAVPGLKEKVKYFDKISYFALLVLMFFSLCFSLCGMPSLLKMSVGDQNYMSVAPVLMFVGLVVTLVGYYMEKGSISIKNVEVNSERPVLTVYKAKFVLYLLIALGAMSVAIVVINITKGIFIGGTVGLLIGAVIADTIWTVVFALPRVLEKIANKKD